MKFRSLAVYCLLVIMFALMTAPVMAALTGNATITGNPTGTIEVSVSGGITGWTLNPGETVTDSTSVSVNVSSNNPGWTLKVHDALDGSKDAGTVGHMAEYNTSSMYTTTKLASAMDIGSATQTGFTGSTITLSGSPQTIRVGASNSTAAGIFDYPITISQPVSTVDAVLSSGAYRIVATFTAGLS